MTARELAENALHQLDPSETTAYVVGAAVLDLADAVRELSGKSIGVEAPFGPMTVSLADRTMDGGVQRGEPEPERRRALHDAVNAIDALSGSHGEGYPEAIRAVERLIEGSP